MRRKLLARKVLKELSSPRTADWLIKVSLVLMLPLALWAAVATWGEFEQAMETIRSSGWGRSFMILGGTMAAMNVAFLLWYVVLVLRYKPHAACTDEQLPTVTVVVPAYNEGRCVYDTLVSLAGSDFPASKLQIIAVDDGSADDTWLWMEKAAHDLPGRVELLRQSRNGGKRRALYDGFHRSTGEILVTVDSDSVVEPDTLRNLVSPFYHDARIGGVAGNVRVLNRDEGLIPRMMEVSFTFSFDFVRAAQSMVQTVMCTPGALSAYRKGLVMKYLDEWLHQKFMGRLSNIGEDRALTNLILRDGHHVTFQRNSVVFTKVPTAYKGLCKMFIRWARSNIRENLWMAGFAFRKFRENGMLGARLNLVNELVTMIVPNILLAFAAGCLLWKPMVFGVQLLLGTVLTAVLPAVVYALRHRSSESILSVAYSLFYMVSLWWINPWSLITLHRSGWLTRTLAQPKPTTGQGPFLPDLQKSVA